MSAAGIPGLPEVLFRRPGTEWGCSRWGRSHLPQNFAGTARARQLFFAL